MQRLFVMVDAYSKKLLSVSNPVKFILSIRQVRCNNLAGPQPISTISNLLFSEALLIKLIITTSDY
jgi:hypothetical protein